MLVSVRVLEIPLHWSFSSLPEIPVFAKESHVCCRIKNRKHFLIVRFSQFDPILLKKSKIERLGKPRERPCSSIEEGSD
jgi:hypothetical protein